MKLYREVSRDSIKSGWTLNDVERVDIHYYFDLLKKEESETVYIDDIKLF